MFKEYQIGYVKFYYEDVIIDNRNSIQEFNRDINIRNSLFTVSVSDVVIDVGAGFGSYTLTALALAAGFVYSFERDNMIASALKRNLGSNQSLRALEKTSVCRWNLNDSSLSIDKYLSELSYSVNNIDYLKIDLGSIPDNRVILWGCKDTIKKYKPNILIADPEPPKLSFLDEYKLDKTIDGHSLLVHRFR